MKSGKKCRRGSLNVADDGGEDDEDAEVDSFLGLLGFFGVV